MKILVVEDEPHIAQAIQKGLQYQNYVVDIAVDGEQGLDLAIGEAYDAIVLDRMLPKVSGLEVCRQLRQEQIATPILMLTALGEVDDKVTGLNGGADDYLAKPFAFEELVARIQALTRRPPTIQNEVLSLGGLTLDTTTNKVERLGKEIHLSKKEFALLSFLLRHPDQVFTADQLTEQVWSFDSDVTANAAQVYIGYLRNKIDKPFSDSPPLLHTVRGFGYRLSE